MLEFTRFEKEVYVDNGKEVLLFASVLVVYLITLFMGGITSVNMLVVR